MNVDTEDLVLDERVSETIVRGRGAPSPLQFTPDVVQALDDVAASAARAPASRSACSGNRQTRRFALITADIVAMGIATVIAVLFGESTREVLLIGTEGFGLPRSSMTLAVMFALPVLLLVSVSHSKGHYIRLKPLNVEVADLLRIVGYTIAVTTLVLFLSKAHFSRIWFVAYWALVMALVPLGRYLTKLALMRANRLFVPLVIFGTGVNAAKCAKAIRNDPMLGLEIVGFVNIGSSDTEANCGAIPADMVLDSGHDRSLLDMRFDRPHMLFALDSWEQLEAKRPVLNALISSSTFVTVSAPMYGLPLDGAEIISVQPSDAVLIRLQNNLAKPHAAFVKRASDIAGSLFAMALLAPLVLVLMVLIKRDGGPLFYRQTRIGRDGRTFDCWKFRSMTVDSERVLREYLEHHPAARAEWALDHKLRDDPRVTTVGSFIRRGSIDELPQLWNVLKGEMSLVGPRPIVLEEQIRYGELLHYYLGNRPGITGLWQTSGRNDTTYDERVDLDVWYSRNWSLWLDIVVMMRTFPAVFMRSGAY